MQGRWIILLGLIIFAADAKAWNVPKDDPDLYYWFMGGFGTTAQQWAKLGVAEGLDVCVQKRSHLFMLRWLRNNEREPGDERIGSESYDVQITPDEDLYEIGLLYGRGKRTGQFIYAAAAGISFVHGARRGALIRREIVQYYDGGTINEVYEERVFETVGLPLSLMFSAQALPMFGIGVELFANANPERSFIGCLLGIQFGHLR